MKVFLIIVLVLAVLCGVCVPAAFLLWWYHKRWKDKKLNDARDAAIFEAIAGNRARYKATVQLKLKQLEQLKHADQWPGQKKPQTRGFTARGEVDPWAFAHWQARQPPQAHETAWPREWV
ncbi:hypothetical protein H2200_004184 [Cladophialophora chaetospira]|uniref:Uncharacterized protein n=1 Tax=Cladophialophora chaetospira TaxID=386627 RepID=A0AA38XFR2_9EURO|nr:hypothetical protein H2200_004184 [Cladophialophora chaetospira]